MQFARPRTFARALALASAIAVPATAYCAPVDGTANLASLAAAPTLSPFLMIAALLAFPACMLAGVFVGRHHYPSSSGLE